MRTITIRQFQQHLYAELATLPLTVTRKGKLAFIVTTSDVTTSTHTPIVTTITHKHNNVTTSVIRTPQDALRAVKARTMTELPLSKHRQASNEL
jgi:hypothetical protein